MIFETRRRVSLRALLLVALFAASTGSYAQQVLLDDPARGAGNDQLNVGSGLNDGTGDSLRNGGLKLKSWAADQNTMNAQIFGGTLPPGTLNDNEGAFANKPSVGVVATANIALSGVQTIDGVLGSAGTTLVLATAQSTASQNGPWLMQSGAWTRPGWYASGNTLQAFQFAVVRVRLGAQYAGSLWDITTAGTITIDMTATTWSLKPTALGALAAVPAFTFPGNTLASATAPGPLAIREFSPDDFAGISPAATATVGARCLNGVTASTGTTNQVVIKNACYTGQRAPVVGDFLVTFGIGASGAALPVVINGVTIGGTNTTITWMQTSGNPAVATSVTTQTEFIAYGLTDESVPINAALAAEAAPGGPSCVKLTRKFYGITNTVLLPTTGPFCLSVSGSTVLALASMGAMFNAVAPSYFHAPDGSGMFGPGTINAMGVANINIYHEGDAGAYGDLALENALVANIKCDAACQGTNFRHLTLNNGFPAADSAMPVNCVNDGGTGGTVPTDDTYSFIKCQGYSGVAFLAGAGSAGLYCFACHAFQGSSTSTACFESDSGKNFFIGDECDQPVANAAGFLINGGTVQLNTYQINLSGTYSAQQGVVLGSGASQNIITGGTFPGWSGTTGCGGCAANAIVDNSGLTTNKVCMNQFATLAEGCDGMTLIGATGSIGGSSLTAGACASGSATITGATTGMAVDASPVTYPGDGIYWRGYVSASNTVAVKVCAAAAGTPTASVYNIRVLQ